MLSKRIFLHSLLLTVLLPGFAQSVRTPVSATYIGLGAYSQNHTDVFSFTANQAALAGVKQNAIGVFGEQRFITEGLQMFSAAGAFRTKQGNFGVQADYFGFKNYNESQLGLAYGRMLSEAIDVGIQFNYFSFRIPGYGASSAVTAELGAIAHLTEQLHAGVHVYNPVGGQLSKTKDEKLGAAYTFGLGYEASKSFLVSVEVIKQEDIPVNVNAGVLYNFAKQFFARAGFSSATESPYGGAGISWNNFRVDVCASYHPQLGFTPGMMLVYNFTNSDE